MQLKYNVIKLRKLGIERKVPNQSQVSNVATLYMDYILYTLMENKLIKV